MTRKRMPKTKNMPAAKARDGKRPGKTSAPAKSNRPQADAADSLVTASAQALKLPLDAAWHAGIKFNLQLILRLGALVDEFPLPDDTEPAPIFRA